MGVSINYLTTQLRGNSFNGVVLGGDYALAKGVRMYGEIGYFNAKEIANSIKNPSGAIIVLGTSVSF